MFEIEISLISLESAKSQSFQVRNAKQEKQFIALIFKPLLFFDREKLFQVITLQTIEIVKLRK